MGVVCENVFFLYTFVTIFRNFFLLIIITFLFSIGRLCPIHYHFVIWIGSLAAVLVIFTAVNNFLHCLTKRFRYFGRTSIRHFWLLSPPESNID